MLRAPPVLRPVTTVPRCRGHRGNPYWPRHVISCQGTPGARRKNSIVVRAESANRSGQQRLDLLKTGRVDAMARSTIGRGSRARMRSRAADAVILLLSLLLGQGYAQPSPQAAPQSSEPVTVLVAWQVDDAADATLHARLEDGRIVGVKAVEPAALAVQIGQQPASNEARWRASIAAGAVSLAVAASPTSRIEIGCDGKTLSTSLLELAESPAEISWSGGHLRVERPPYDIVRVQLKRPSLVLAPGEELNVQFEFFLLSSREDPIPTRIRLTLVESGRKPVEYAIDGRYRVPPGRPEQARFNLKMRAPQAPGVYEIVLVLGMDGKPDIYRRVPFVVVDSKPPVPNAGLTVEEWWAQAKLLASARNSGGEWRLSRPWWGWWNGLRQLLRTTGTVPVAALDEESAWLLRLPSDESLYVLQLIGGNRSGEPVMRITLGPQEDAQVVRSFANPVELTLAARPGPLARTSESDAAIAIFPAASSPALRLSAASMPGGGGTAEWRIYRVPSLSNLVRTHRSRLPDWRDGRHRALFVEHLDQLFLYGGVLAESDWEGEAASSWTALYRAAENLCTYGAALGADAVVMAATISGRPTWPSQVIPTAEWDPDERTRTLAKVGTKDIPELLFRATRRGLLFYVPLLDFGPDEKIDPLSDEGQKKAVAVLAEFLRRYGHHDNFPAVCVRLSPRAGTCLADLRDGVDAHTLEQFLRESGLKPGDADVASWVMQHAREQFIRWRCARIANLFKSLAETAASGKFPKDLVVLLDLNDREWSDYLRASFHQGGDLGAALRESGIAFELWPDNENIILCRPYLDAEHSIRSVWINRDDALNGLLGDRGFSLAGLHGPERLIDENSRTAVVLPDSGSVGSGVVRMLAEIDPTWVLSDGTIPTITTRPFYFEVSHLLHTLPASTKGERQKRGPVVVRSWRDEQVCTWFFANVSDFPVLVRAQFSDPGQVRQKGAKGSDTAEIADGRNVQVELRGGGFVVLTAPASTRMNSLDIQLPEASRNYLRERFEDLMHAVDFLRDESQIATPNILTDGGFEQRNGMGSRWEFVPPDAAQFVPEARRSGQVGLRVSGEATEGAYVLSWPFTLPPGAEALIRFYARSSGGSPKLSVWLVAADSPRQAVVAHEYELTAEWKQYEVRARDLPSDKWSWRLVFRCAGGTVDLDDVEIEARTLTPEERNVLIKSLAPAVRAWYEKRWEDFSSMTSEYWPQYLMRRFQRDETR